jgi:hypothetical protein
MFSHNRIAQTFLLPLITLLLLAGIIFLISHFTPVFFGDLLFGYIIAFFVAIIIYLIYHNRWIKTPEKSWMLKSEYNNKYHRLIPESVVLPDPALYEYCFYPSKMSKVVLIVTAIVLWGVSFLLIMNRFYFMPACFIFSGFYLIITGIGQVRKRKPVICISNSGLWTQILGFKSWHDIKFTKLIKEKRGRQTCFFLEIYLKDSLINEPAHRLQLDNLKEKTQIKPLIDEASKGQ